MPVTLEFFNHQLRIYFRIHTANNSCRMLIALAAYNTKYSEINSQPCELFD